MTDTQATRLHAVYTDYLRPLIAWLKDMTQGEKLMLIATLSFGLVGAYGTYLFYQPSRGWFIGAAAATGIELLYIGAAGVAVKHPSQKWLAWILIAIGAIGSAYFGVMVSLKEALPATFDAQAGAAVRWPTFVSAARVPSSSPAVTASRGT